VDTHSLDPGNTDPNRKSQVLNEGKIRWQTNTLLRLFYY
jgi:hypothetical protein